MLVGSNKINMDTILKVKFAAEVIIVKKKEDSHMHTYPDYISPADLNRPDIIVVVECKCHTRVNILFQYAHTTKLTI